jgi:hypothetical protein
VLTCPSLPSRMPLTSVAGAGTERKTASTREVTQRDPDTMEAQRGGGSADDSGRTLAPEDDRFGDAHISYREKQRLDVRRHLRRILSPQFSLFRRLTVLFIEIPLLPAISFLLPHPPCVLGDSRRRSPGRSLQWRSRGNCLRSPCQYCG